MGKTTKEQWGLVILIIAAFILGFIIFQGDIIACATLIAIACLLVLSALLYTMYRILCDS